MLGIEDASPNIAGPSGTFEQCPRTNIYGQAGSYLCFKCPSISPAVLAKQVGAKNAAILTYSHPSSTACGDGDEASFKKYGINIAFVDRTLNFGFPDASDDAQKMKDAGVDYVATCMDFGGAYKISQELKQAGATGVTFYAPEGYRQDTLDKYGDNLNGWVFRIGFSPWQGKNLPKGTKEYLAAMKKAGVKPSEQSQAGWINAALLTEGIKKAGKDFTWSSVNEAIDIDHRLHRRRHPRAAQLVEHGQRARARQGSVRRLRRGEERQVRAGLREAGPAVRPATPTTRSPTTSTTRTTARSSPASPTRWPANG